ncbi:hypothetical protein FRC10_003062 [Ceratobasidium sp. 414]|nr:hypothetical protein FRC10_003062 [Ceratobasidium sp. 414]
MSICRSIDTQKDFVTTTTNWSIKVEVRTFGRRLHGCRNGTFLQGSAGNKKELEAKAGPDKGRGGLLLAGTESQCIQLWDLAKIEKSAVLSGLDTEQGPPQYRLSVE